MRHFYRGSLALRVLIITLLVVALPLFIYFFAASYHGYGIHLARTLQDMRVSGEARGYVLDETYRFANTLAGVFDDFILAQIDEEGKLQAPAKLSQALKRVADRAEFDSATFIKRNKEGRYVAIASSNKQFIGRDYTDYGFVEETLEQGKDSYFSTGAEAFERILYVSRLIQEKGKEPIGIINLGTEVSQLLDPQKLQARGGILLDYSLMDSRGVVILSSNRALELQRVRHKPEGTEQKAAEIFLHPMHEAPSSYEFNYQGAEYLGVEVPIPSMGLTLLVSVNRAAALHIVIEHLVRVTIIMLVIFAIGGGVALWLTYRLSTPLGRLRDAMRRVSKGDLTARYETDRMGFELNMIGSMFNETIDTLCDNMAQAEAERVQKETLRKELSIGQEIQQTILPHEELEFPGVDLATRYIPAKEVGGDFYDFFERAHQDASDLVFTVADASGKGISACLYSLGLRSILRTCAAAFDDVSKMAQEANNLFCQDTGDTGMFVTALMAIYHPEIQTLTYTGCGHNPGFVRRVDGTIERLESDELPMGIQPMGTTREASLKLESGDLVLFYTDGITETHNQRNELYGDERLADFLSAHGSQAVNPFLDALMTDVIAFRSTAAQYDDITLLAIRIQ